MWRHSEGFRAKIDFDLFERRPYSFGVLRAADIAKELGIKRIAVLEFGVASGRGLLSLCRIAERVSKLVGLDIDVIGFDTGRGMPAGQDYRDHPEYYQAGDFPMDEAALRSRLPANCRLVIGDVADTAAQFLREYSGVIGFVAIDVDFYSSTVSCLNIFTGKAEQYLHVVPIYLDDVWMDSHCPWAGELLAITEFTSQQQWRKIVPWTGLRDKRYVKNATWISKMYALHVLDHPARSTAIPRRQPVIM